MTTKVVQKLTNLGLIALIVLATISCDNDIESIGLNLVNNNTFETDSSSKEITTSTENINSVPANNIGQYLLGVYADAEFGKLKGSIVTQLLLPTSGTAYATGFGTNTVIDSVLVSIPYQSTADGTDSTGKPKFVLDSVFGDTSKEFKISIYELKTFLNTLDPNDPSKSAVYQSDKVFQKGTEAFYSGNFKVNANDTVSYIKRYAADGVTVFKRDTIKATGSKPSIKLPLNEALIKQYFVDNASNAEFQSLDNFIRFFRGFYIEASEVGNESAHIISLSMADAKMTIYYSKTVDEGDDQDLNGNGTKGEKAVRTGNKYDYLFSTALKSNIYERDYTVSKKSGSERLYVQGAAGSIATAEVDMSAYANKNWLITDASLTFFVDQNASSSIIPERLSIYNYTKKTFLIDGLYGNTNGALVRDADGKPYKYVFKITDYISNLIKGTEALGVEKFGIKVYNGVSDEPQSFSDTAIKNLSWTPKGVVLYNHNLIHADKRATFKISYTQLNN